MEMMLNQMADSDLGSGTFGQSHGLLKNGVAFGIEVYSDSGGFGHGVMVLRKKLSMRTRAPPSLQRGEFPAQLIVELHLGDQIPLGILLCKTSWLVIHWLLLLRGRCCQWLRIKLLLELINLLLQARHLSGLLL